MYKDPAAQGRHRRWRAITISTWSWRRRRNCSSAPSADVALLKRSPGQAPSATQTAPGPAARSRRTSRVRCPDGSPIGKHLPGRDLPLASGEALTYRRLRFHIRACAGIRTFLRRPWKPKMLGRSIFQEPRRSAARAHRSHLCMIVAQAREPSFTPGSTARHG